MASAVRDSTGRSLVLVDEFGKGTSSCDGRALLAACAEDLLEREGGRRPFAVVATHFHDLRLLLAEKQGEQ